MTKQIIYKYLGTNGVIESPVFLEGIYSVKSYILTADEGKILYNGQEKKATVKCSESEVAQWREIKR